jgi:hypothetical protein
VAIGFEKIKNVFRLKTIVRYAGGGFAITEFGKFIIIEERRFRTQK